MVVVAVAAGGEELRVGSAALAQLCAVERGGAVRLHAGEELLGASAVASDDITRTGLQDTAGEGECVRGGHCGC